MTEGEREGGRERGRQRKEERKKIRLLCALWLQVGVHMVWLCKVLSRIVGDILHTQHSPVLTLQAESISNILGIFFLFYSVLFLLSLNWMAKDCFLEVKHMIES